MLAEIPNTLIATMNPTHLPSLSESVYISTFT